MNELVILTDSSCDLPIELINKMKIEVMPLSILIDDKEFLDCADEHDIKYSTMYNLMRNNKTIKTAAVLPRLLDVSWYVVKMYYTWAFHLH